MRPFVFSISTLTYSPIFPAASFIALARLQRLSLLACQAGVIDKLLFGSDFSLRRSHRVHRGPLLAEPDAPGHQSPWFTANPPPRHRRTRWPRRSRIVLKGPTLEPPGGPFAFPLPLLSFRQATDPNDRPSKRTRGSRSMRLFLLTRQRHSASNPPTAPGRSHRNSTMPSSPSTNPATSTSSWSTAPRPGSSRSLPRRASSPGRPPSTRQRGSLTTGDSGSAPSRIRHPPQCVHSPGMPRVGRK